MDLEGMHRVQLLATLIAQCDTDGDGRITPRGFLPVALQVGFDGSPGDWCNEFAKLCRDYEPGGSDARGLSERSVYDILEDASEEGGYIADAEIRGLLRRWASGEVGEGSGDDLAVAAILSITNRPVDARG